MENTLAPHSTGTGAEGRLRRPALPGCRRHRARVAVAIVGVSWLGLGVLASAAQTAGACPNDAARSGPSASLPDCRAYEQVTPVNKSSAVQDMDPGSSFALPSVGGDHVALQSLVAFGPRPMPNGSFSVFSRTSSGWQIESVAPPGAGSAFVQNETIFNPDMTQVGIGSYTTTPLSPDQLFQIGPPGGPYTTVARTPTNYQRRPGEVDFLAGATADFSRLFLESTDRTLLSGSPTGTVEGALDLYEWADGGLRRLVNVDSAGAPVSPCGAKFDAASESGSMVVFTSPYNRNNELSDPSCLQPAELYMRAHGSSTADVSKPNTGVVDPTGIHPVQFQGASADGSKVFFTTQTELTRDDEGIHDEELYEYDASAPEGERLTRVSAGTTGTAAGGIAREFVLPSKNGSEVYFFATGKLTPEAPAGGVEILYRYDTTARKIHYIATAKTGTYAPSGAGNGPRPSAAGYDQVTPDGEVFVFVSDSVIAAEPIDEIYRYDNRTASLACISCPPSNVPARGGASLANEGVTPWDETPPVTTVSEDGSYVFFESNDELVPQDVNGPLSGNPSFQTAAPGTDVYEWHDGVVSLISSGTDSGAALLYGASRSGSDVFFMTHSQLVAGDTDSSNDIYDARVDGGFPVAGESVACLGDTCQGAPPTVNDLTPAWSSFSGPGNLVAPVSGPAVRSLAKAQLLAKALKACRAKHNRGKRRSCEALAKRRYGAAHRAKRSTRTATRRSVSHKRGGSR